MDTLRRREGEGGREGRGIINKTDIEREVGGREREREKEETKSSSHPGVTLPTYLRGGGGEGGGGGGLVHIVTR